jgi:hypothetical protein
MQLTYGELIFRNVFTLKALHISESNLTESDKEYDSILEFSIDSGQMFSTVVAVLTFVVKLVERIEKQK